MNLDRASVLEQMENLLGAALKASDYLNEPLLGAKIDDAMVCVQEIRDRH